MNFFYYLLMIIAGFAFVGVGIYTVVGAWYFLCEAGLPFKSPVTRRERLSRIPQPIGKLGRVSFSVFIGCLVVGAIASLMRK